MKKASNNYFIGVFILITITQAIVIAYLLGDSSDSLLIIGWVTTAIFPLVSLIYNFGTQHSLRFYLLTQQLQNWFGGRSATWNFSVRIEGDFTKENVDESLRKLLEGQEFEGIRITRPTSKTATIIIPLGTTIDLTMGIQDGFSDLPKILGDKNYIHLSFRNFRVNLRDTGNLIERSILPVIGAIERGLKVSNRAYGMTINFDKSKNPFFGLYLGKVSPDEITAFNVDLTIKDYKADDKVSITESSVQITAHSANAIANLGKEFLTFHPNLRLRLRNG